MSQFPPFLALNHAGVYQMPDGTGSGNVTGPASSTDSHLASFDGITGILLKDSGVDPTTAADGTVGVRIHANDKVLGRRLFVGNNAAAVLKVYPPTGGTINGAGADVAFSSESGAGAWMVCTSVSSNTWLAFS